MNISFEQVIAFVTVAETGSFSAAAKVLGKHRTTLGQVITNLEIEVNMGLFDRSGKFPTLTDDGLALYEHAKNLAETSRAFEQLCHKCEQGIESDVTVYHSDLMPVGLIVDVMSALRQTFSQVKVHWLHRSLSEVKQAFISGEADLAVVMVHDASSVSSLDFTYLMSLPFCLCATPDFIEQHELGTIETLKRAHQLVLEDYHYAGVNKIVSLSSYAQRIENINIFLNLLESGEGWAIAPYHAVRQAIASGKLSRIALSQLNTTLRFPMCIWRPRQAQVGPVTSELVRLIKHHAKAYEELTEDSILHM